MARRRASGSSRTPVTVPETGEYLALSGLQHLSFCPRQWALIHLEQIWAENVLTFDGRRFHERVESGETETRDGVRTERSLRISSRRLGIVGVADVVEFHEAEGLVVPVEYKRGRRKSGGCDEVQLCAQALCLEEMLSVEIPRGALFYGKTRRRVAVNFDESLRQETEQLCQRMQDLYRVGETPKARREAKCSSCSLLSLCMPELSGKKARLERYVQSIWDCGEP